MNCFSKNMVKRKEYQKLAEEIMELLNLKLPCIIHFDNLDYFMRMNDLISKSDGVLTE